MLAVSSIALVAAMPVHAQPGSVCTQATGRYAVIAVRPLGDGEWSSGEAPPLAGSTLDAHNLEEVHEHIFFCDGGRVTGNVGFFPRQKDAREGPGTLRRDEHPARYRVRDPNAYDARVIEQSVSAWGDPRYELFHNNCQDFAQFVRDEYWRRVLEGTWEGTLRQPGRAFRYTVTLRHDEGMTFTGSSRIEPQGDASRFGEMALEAELVNGEFRLRETGITRENPPPELYWCVKRAVLRPGIRDGVTRLEGEWSQFGCNRGTVTLERRPQTAR